MGECIFQVPLNDEFTMNGFNFFNFNHFFLIIQKMSALYRSREGPIVVSVQNLNLSIKPEFQYTKSQFQNPNITVNLDFKIKS